MTTLAVGSLQAAETIGAAGSRTYEHQCLLTIFSGRRTSRRA
jgi:hypothetical protein